MGKNKRKKFKSEIIVEKDKDRVRILDLKRKYENNEIFETDLSDEDMKALIKIYEEEAKEIEQDIQMRKLRISHLLGKK